MGMVRLGAGCKQHSHTDSGGGVGEVKACQGSRALPAATAVALPPFNAVKFPQSISALSCFMDLPCAARQTSC